MGGQGCCVIQQNGQKVITVFYKSSSSSIGTATLVGFGPLNYRWVFSAGRFLQSAVASGTSNPQLGGPVIRTFHLPPRLKRRERTLAAEGGTMGEKLPRILPKVATSTSLLGSFTCRKFTTWDRRLYFPSEGRRAEDFFGRIWTRELGYQRPARLPLDHRSRYYFNLIAILWFLPSSNDSISIFSAYFVTSLIWTWLIIWNAIQ
jgi:hypothetical protein